VLRSTASSSRSPTDAALSEIVGVSAVIARVRHWIALASRADVNVLVRGETGTGKELAARAIHRLSDLGKGPFVAHNCALTPSELFDSQMFGHRRGAFTGADAEHSGLLRAADGGVLFLDELECLSLANQAKLLRVLDDGAVRALGSERCHKVSVRFFAATNRSVQSMIERGELRDDLYYRLGGFEIELPPLRERREDIVPLARHFLEGRADALTDRAADALVHRSWPGNVRELRTVVRRAASLAGSGAIDETHLEVAPSPSGVPRLPGSAPRPAPRPAPHATEERPTPLGARTIVDAEREAVIEALALHDGNRGRAAEALGIHRSTLRRKMRELGLESRGTRK
jgi:two-component system NtrC family response regulator